MLLGSPEIGGFRINVDWNTRISSARASRAATAPISGLRRIRPSPSCSWWT
jgi:hypothetical protein